MQMQYLHEFLLGLFIFEIRLNKFSVTLSIHLNDMFIYLYVCQFVLFAA